MERSEVGIKLPENSANTTGSRVAMGAMQGVVEAAVDFAKEVMPDSLKRNQPEQPRPAPRQIIVLEDSKKIDAVRAELRALKAAPANQPRPAAVQQPSA